MLDWKNYRLKLKNRIGAFGKLQPKTLQGYQALSQAGEDSPLDLKTRELIALAVAVTTHCDGCITVHVEAAIKAGCTREEIAMNAGAAMVYSARVLDAYEASQD